MTYVLLALFVAVTAGTYWLRTINLRYGRKHGSTVPAGFEGAIDGETLARSAAYTLDRSRLELWESLFDNVLLILFLFAGLLPIYDHYIAGLSESFIVRGVLFFLILTWVLTLLELPFSYYGTFVVESRHGFNATTLRLWFTDLLKSQAIGSLLLTIIAAAAFRLVLWSPQHWWLWVWAFTAFFSVFLMFLSPYVIEPLFNKFEPVNEEGLEGEIAAMMNRAGLSVGRVVKMDASRRSRHSNAYFTGIGKVKRIVLFDTLLKQMSHAEIVAVLAHEIGHWKLRHILKRLVVTEAMLLVGSWLAFTVVQWPGLPGVLGMEGASLPARLVIFGFIASLVMFPVTPLSSWLSRRDEQAADRFACRMTGNSTALASALIKLSVENLANLHPHPIYARFYYSHPPTVERVRTLSAWTNVD